MICIVPHRNIAIYEGGCYDTLESISNVSLKTILDLVLVHKNDKIIDILILPKPNEKGLCNSDVQNYVNVHYNDIN